VGHTSISSGLFRLEASRARVFLSASKLTEARWQVVHVASSQRSRRVETDDGQVDAMGCVRPL
jgi:hypothetical protein